MSFFNKYGQDLVDYLAITLERYPKIYQLLDISIQQYILEEGTRFKRSSPVAKRLFTKKVEAYRERLAMNMVFTRLSRILIRFLRFVTMITRCPRLTVKRYEKLKKYRAIRSARVMIPEPVCPIARRAWGLPPLKKKPTCNCGGKGCRWCWR